MRRIVSSFACSLDGYIAGPNNEYDWILIDKEVDFAAWNKRFDAFLYGRKTYEISKGFGTGSKKIRHFVFSTTLQEVAPGYSLVQGDLAPFIRDLKEQPGKDIAVFGGAGLLSSLLDLKEVDELHVSVIPVLLGSGIPMVQTLASKTWLQLTATKTYGNGTVLLSYEIRNSRPA